ncbi:MAG: hypothetical protein QF554_11310 [Dehalococcoidia bacterium]|nr:hypothetical protein [Dehalococcoidia bacterium]
MPSDNATRSGRRGARGRTDSDDSGTGRSATRTRGRRSPTDRAELGRMRADLRSLRKTVENDHDHRLRRIETDLRWVIVLLGGQIVALVGAAVAGVVGA